MAGKVHTISREEIERTRIFASIFRAIDLRVDAGESATALFREFDKRWRGSFYRCNPKRRIKISADTLKRLYYRNWLRSGRRPEALHRRFGATAVARFHFTTAQQFAIRRTLLDPSTISLEQVFASLFPARLERGERSKLYRSLPKVLRKAARKIFLLRLAQRRAERAFARFMEGKEP